MLASITPLGEQGRRRRWGRTVTAFVIASTLGGAPTGLVAGALGPLLLRAAHGMSIELPDGWEGKIYRRQGGDPTLHAANYALPGWDGDFGSVATEHMPVNGSFLVITEYRPGQGLEAGKGLFAAEAIPLPL